MRISILDPELQEGVHNTRAWLGMLGSCLEFYACLANYSLMGSQDVALTFGAVNWCFGAWPTTPEPRDLLLSPRPSPRQERWG